MQKPNAIAFDAFGTLIQYGGVRLNPYRLLLDGRPGDHLERLPFLTRNVPPATFADELKMSHVMPKFEIELATELAEFRLFNEVPEVLARARQAGLQIAVCSNLAQAYGDIVRRLLPDLDAHILSFEVGAAKPQPAIYAATCKVLGSAPADVIFVGDSQRCDLNGPQAFGMQARWLDRGAGHSLLDALSGVL